MANWWMSHRSLHAAGHDGLGDKLSLTLPRISGFIGLLAALATACESGMDQQRGQGSVIGRTQFSLQLTVILLDACCMVGTAAAPPDAHRWGAIGTTTTCEIQGFLVQFGYCTFVPIDMFLSICHVLIVRYNWSEGQLRRVEKPFHWIVWPLGLGLASFPLFTDSYNSSWEKCWINAHPSGCGDESGLPCERGGSQLASSAPLLFSIVFAVFSFTTTVYSMTTIYCFVRARENAVSRFDFETSVAFEASESGVATSRRRSTIPGSIGRRRSRATGVQGILYCCVTLISTLPTVIFVAVDTVQGWNLTLATIAGSMLPLVALFNMLVYFRTRTIMQTPYGRFIKMLLQRCGKTFCCCWNRAENAALTRRSSSVGSGSTRLAKGRSKTTRNAPVARPSSLADPSSSVPITEETTEQIEQEGEDLES